MALAFFDLDRTLLSVNSATLWVRREVALGHMQKRQALRAMMWLASYQLGFASAEELVAQAIWEARGTDAAELIARTNSFYETQLSQAYRPLALEALARHRAKGDRLVLLTSSSQFLARLAAQQLQLDEVLCSHLAVGDDGLLTGYAKGRVCFGQGKLFHAEACAQREGARLLDAAFYTDSYSDVPALEAVGRPVAVNPDPRLRRHAEKREWEIVDWGTPIEQAA